MSSGAGSDHRLHLGTDTRLEIVGESGDAHSVTVPGTGRLLRWFTDHFTDSDQSVAVVEGATVFTIIDEKSSGIAPGCEGLRCLVQEEGGAALIGLKPHHGRYHVYRAILEGSAFALRAALEAEGTPPGSMDRVTVTGAGARSRLWLQIHADVLGVTVTGEREAQPDPARRDLLEAAYQELVSFKESAAKPPASP